MKSNVMRSVLALFILLIFTGEAMARARLSRTVPIAIPKNELAASFTSKDIEKIIPLDMHATDNADHVAQRIGDRALQMWFDRPEVRNSAMGRAATTVEEATKVQAEFGGDEPEDVHHRFSFQVMALQAVTRLQYSGWLNAAMNYDARVGATIVEVTEKIWTNKDFVLSHKAASGEDFSSVGVRWAF
jgi:hypothetical protein